MDELLVLTVGELIALAVVAVLVVGVPCLLVGFTFGRHRALAGEADRPIAPGGLSRRERRQLLAQFRVWLRTFDSPTPQDRPGPACPRAPGRAVGISQGGEAAMDPRPEETAPENTGFSGWGLARFVRRVVHRSAGRRPL